MDHEYFGGVSADATPVTASFPVAERAFVPEFAQVDHTGPEIDGFRRTPNTNGGTLSTIYTSVKGGVNNVYGDEDSY